MPEAVLSNTSPLQYLFQLGHLELLPRFYRQVTVPPAVVQELADGRALGVALPVPEQLPWVQVQAPAAAPGGAGAGTLGAGEQAVLALALATPNALVLLDDGRARRVGQALGLRMTGTVGVLARARREGLVPRLAPLLDRLATLGFRLSAPARTTALTLVGEGP